MPARWAVKGHGARCKAPMARSRVISSTQAILRAGCIALPCLARQTLSWREGCIRSGQDELPPWP
eukprot:614761-Alexandrium_andersonii.AAC.1